MPRQGLPSLLQPPTLPKRPLLLLLFLLLLGACELGDVGLGDEATPWRDGGAGGGTGPTGGGAGPSPVDAGRVPADAGRLPLDAGASAADAGARGTDGGTPATDAGRPSPDEGSPGEGPVLKDRLTGVNWFGFETSNLSPHGLWARDYKSVLKQIKDRGFNAVRIPWCSDTLTGKPSSIQVNAYGTDPYTKEKGLNTDLEGLSSIQVLDRLLAECERIGLKVILDNHSRAPDGYMNETIWYTPTRAEADWLRDWKFIAERYRNNTAVVAADVKNEPHGNMTKGMKPPATWGYDEPGQGHTGPPPVSLTL